MTDTNVDNYTVDDILAILNVTDPTPANVTDAANTLIARMKIEKQPALEKFFTLARDKVLAFLSGNTTDISNATKALINEGSASLEQIWTESGFTFNDNNKTEIPVRYYGGGSHVVAENQQQVSTENTAPPIIATHIINIDSQYRTNIIPYSDNPLSNTFNTNFTFNLSNPIMKAISINLYSYQIPTTWYAFTAKAGNTFLMYNGIVINIPDGNYTPATLVAAINTTALTNLDTNQLVVTYNTTTNRISFTNNDLLSGPVTLLLFIQANVINFNDCGNFTLDSFQTLGINATLGWLLGFRTTPDPTTGDVAITINPGETITADVPPNTYGPKYFVLSIEDYSNQRLTSGLFNITNTKKQASISIADYYNTVQVACKLREGSLTQAQLYAINAVTESSKVNNTIGGFNNKLSGPNSGTAFAIIPLNDIERLRPNPYIKFGADLALFKRNYASPTNLQRFNVTLSDDKGNLVNLYDNDWAFTLIVQERLN